MKIELSILEEIENSLQEYVSEFFEWSLGERKPLVYEDSWNGEASEEIESSVEEDKESLPELKFHILFAPLPDFMGKGSYMTVHLCDGDQMHRVLICNIKETSDNTFTIMKEYENLHLISSKILQ